MGRWVLAAVYACMVLAACGSNSSAGSPSATAASPSPAVSSSVAPDRPTPLSTQEAAAPCAKRTLAFDPEHIDLTGAWLGNDAGIYYVRQIGKHVWWNGMSGQAGPPRLLGRDWNNVAAGEINADLTIELDWADVPRGGILGAGTLSWKVEEVDGNTRMRKVSETGTGFGGAILTPCAPG